MNPLLSTLVSSIQTEFGAAILNVVYFRDESTLLIRKEKIVNLCRFLRDNTIAAFPICEDVCGVDTFERRDRFEVVYHFFSLTQKVRIALKVKVDMNDCVVPTITGVYPGADWCERETFDMFGIAFTDHPDLRRMYMPEDFEYYPLRKDFPLMGIPGSIPLPKR